MKNRNIFLDTARLYGAWKMKSSTGIWRKVKIRWKKISEGRQGKEVKKKRLKTNRRWGGKEGARGEVANLCPSRQDVWVSRLRRPSLGALAHQTASLPPCGGSLATKLSHRRSVRDYVALCSNGGCGDARATFLRTSHLRNPRHARHLRRSLLLTFVCRQGRAARTYMPGSLVAAAAILSHLRIISLGVLRRLGYLSLALLYPFLSINKLNGKRLIHLRCR